MIGVVLAAGQGKRLRPFTETRPKPLIPVLDKPLLYYPLKFLADIGVKHVAIVVHYMKERVIECAKALANELGIEVEFFDQGGELGTGHALKVVHRDVEDDIVVVYGDLYIDDGASRLFHKAVSSLNEDRMFMASVAVDDVSRYGKLVVDGVRVLDIVEKPSEGGAGLVNAGIYAIPSKILRLVEHIDRSERGEYELTDLIKLALKSGFAVYHIEIPRTSWLDVGTPWNVIEVNKRVLEKIRTRIVRGSVDSFVTMKGPVVIDDGAEVRGATYIEGPAYIGKNAVVGPNSYIRPYTVIGEGARIGFSVEVKESVVFEHAHAAHLAYIGDSVVGERVNLGAGTILANLRFDEKTVKVTIENVRVDSGRKKLGAFIGGYVKTGVNVSIMPGVKIGSYSIIYPGVVVYKDVPPKTVVKSDWL